MNDAQIRHKVKSRPNRKTTHENVQGVAYLKKERKKKACFLYKWTYEDTVKHIPVRPVPDNANTL